VPKLVTLISIIGLDIILVPFQNKIQFEVFEESRETFFKKFFLWGAGQRPAICASEWRRPADIPEGVKSSLQGRFLLLRSFYKIICRKG
jgi:hypothetical protein